jgi:hypothetical protein
MIDDGARLAESTIYIQRVKRLSAFRYNDRFIWQSGNKQYLSIINVYYLFARYKRVYSDKLYMILKDYCARFICIP